MIRFDQHRAPVEVVQFIAPEDGRCSYLLACGQTRVAALVDPDPAMEQDYLHEIEVSGLRLRAVFDTADRDEAPGDLWDNICRVGPRGSSRLLQADQHTIEVGISPDGAHRYTIFGSANPPAPGCKYSPVFAAFGAFKIAVIPLEARLGQFAYRVGDRLFTGLELRNSANSNGTPDQLLALQDHTIVYPGWRAGTASISIIGSERHVHAPKAQPVPLLQRDPATDEHEESEAFVEELPASSLEPMDYWTSLETGREFVNEARYEEAQHAFKAALAARPGDIIAGQNLKRVEEIIHAAQGAGARL